MPETWYSLESSFSRDESSIVAVRCKVCDYRNAYVFKDIPGECPYCKPSSLEVGAAFSLIDLTQIDQVTMDQLHLWQKSVADMYDRCLEKRNIGAANAMYTINSLIIDEIKFRMINSRMNKN